MTLSVIVPIYKVEFYLRDCLDSLCRQSVNDVEFILVDDGSPDNCGKIAEEYTKKDSRIKVFHKENGGLISAWKFGLARATGEYIGFVDSDDYVEDNMFAVLIENAKKSDADIVCCNYYSDESGVYKIVKLSAECGIYDRQKIVNELLPFAVDTGNIIGYQRCVSSVRWNKLFKKKILLNNMKYYDERVSFGEDLLVTYSALAIAQSVAVIDDALYNFRSNPQSITHSYNKNLKEQFERCNVILLQIAKDYELECYEQIYRNAAHTAFRIIANELNNPISNRQQKKKVVHGIIFDENVQKGAHLISLKRASFKQRVKFYLLKHKKVGLLMHYYNANR